MKTVIVLAMHGAPPKDFPQHDLRELMGLHGRLEHACDQERVALEHRHSELETRVRAWPRTNENDPFHAGSLALADQLSSVTGLEVIAGFNEFCAPSLGEAVDQAVVSRADRVILVTPMMTCGGEHSEIDIPNAIRRAGERHPGIDLVYAWPFDLAKVAEFLAAQIGQFSSRQSKDVLGAEESLSR